MKYFGCILALTILLSCAKQSQVSIEHDAAIPTPSATSTSTPISYENSTSDLFRNKKNEIPNDAKRILDQAEKLEIILLKPVGGIYHPNIKYKLNSNDTYYGYGVLGKAVVSDAKAKELREALYSSVAAIRTGESAACFYPRHGLRAKYKGKTTELLICFRCMNFYTYTANGQTHPPINAISRDAQRVFNRMLNEAGVLIE